MTANEKRAEWDHTTICYGNDCPNCRREGKSPNQGRMTEPKKIVHGQNCECKHKLMCEDAEEAENHGTVRGKPVAPKSQAEELIDFEAAERWAKTCHPGIDKGDWMIARAYLALASTLKKRDQEIERVEKVWSASNKRLEAENTALRERVSTLEELIVEVQCDDQDNCDLYAESRAILAARAAKGEDGKGENRE